MSPITLHARVLDGVGGAREATDAEILAGRTDAGPLWLHLSASQEGVADWLREAAGLDEVTTEALLVDDPRPRSLVVKDGLLVVLRGINIHSDARPEDMVSVRIWVEKDRVFTLRGRRVGSAQDVLQQLDGGHGPTSSGGLLQELTDRLLDRIGEAVQDLEDTGDALEESVIGSEGRELRTRLSELRRRTIALRRYIAPQRDTLGRLYAERVTFLDDITRARLRECSDRVTRYLESMDSTREHAAVTGEELTNRLAEQMNQTMYTLSVVAAIFLPLGLLTGLLGINVGGVPGADEPWAFALVTALLVVIGALEWLWFKRRNLF